METTTTKYSVHCKVNYNNLIRRFMFIGTEFTSLKETVKKLCSINHEFVLKYIDDENDQIVMECQQDFLTALQVTPRVLRLVITAGTSCTNPISAPSVFTPVQDMEDCCPADIDTSGPEVEVPLCNPLSTCNVGIPDHRKLRLERKLNFVNQALSDFGTDESKLTPRQILRKQRLLKQQERIIACLSGNCPRKSFSPESRLFVKQQKLLIKSEICALKARKRELKMLFRENKDDKLLLEAIMRCVTAERL
jgi:hypothetical protein